MYDYSRECPAIEVDASLGGTEALDNGGVPSSENGCVLGICRVADGVAVEQAASTRTNNPRMMRIRSDMILLPRNSSTLL